MATREFSDDSTIDAEQIHNNLDMIDRELNTVSSTQSGGERNSCEVRLIHVNFIKRVLGNDPVNPEAIVD